MRAKIFGIGFHKTGTQSLAEALTILGYKTIHGDSPNIPPYGDEGISLTRQIDIGDYNLSTIASYDAFTDNPYFSIWKQLDLYYPNSKFILTIRDSNEWIESAVRYYKNRRVRHMRQWMFGKYANPASSANARDTWVKAYHHHNTNVIKHFKNRADDLLILDISSGEGWNELCSFLDKPLPKLSFPFKNRSLIDQPKGKFNPLRIKVILTKLYTKFQ